MSDLRDRITEITESSTLADKILNLKVEVKCPECRGMGGWQTTPTIVNPDGWKLCPHCKSGYITKTLKEMVGE